MKNRFIKLRNKFLKQQLSEVEEQELHTIEQFILQKQKNKALKSQLEKERIKNEMYQQVKVQINRPVYDWMLKAASVLLVLSLGSTVFYLNTTSYNEKVYENISAATQEIILSDSSTVILKKNSKLVLAGDFNKQHRNVTLYGQAFFNVSRNEKKPFKVTTGKLTTRVLGTSFNINHMIDEVKVTVASGLVSVTNDKLQIKLTPDKQAVYNVKYDELTKKEVNHNLETFWFKNEIELKNISIDELSGFLETNYAVECKYIDQESKYKRISIHITKDDTLNSILRSINYINEVQLEKTENNVIQISLANSEPTP